jgi:outer membrane protein OmpA-like peptidoglycan-associated protein
MAQPEYKSKPSFRWIWLLAVLVVIGVAYTLFNKRSGSPTDSAPGLDSTGMAADTANAGSQGLAANGPDWKRVDFKSPASVDPAISDKSIRVSGNKDYTIYKIDESMLFMHAQSRLQQSAGAKLEQIAKAINKRYRTPSIALFGGAYSTDEPSNPDKELGIQRSIAIKEWLLKEGGFGVEQVSVQSLGQANSVVAIAKSSKPPSRDEFVIVAYRKGATSR